MNPRRRRRNKRELRFRRRFHKLFPTVEVPRRETHRVTWKINREDLAGLSGETPRKVVS
jgi:hypothetical protein